MALPAGIKAHYEKIIAACCFLILFTNVGLPSTSFPVYQPYLVALPGVGHSGGSIIISVRTLVSLLAMMLVARFYGILDCRRGVCTAAIFVVAGFAIYSASTDNFIGLCAGSAFTGLGYGLGGMVASTMLISRWYKSNVATVAGIAAAGSGVAVMVLPTFFVWLINNYSLSASFAFESCLAAVCALVLYLLIRNQPKDIGCVPYEAEPKPSKKGESKARISRNLPAKWVPVVIMAMVFVGCISVGGTSYLAVLFTSEGLSAEYAAFLVATCGTCLTFAKLFSGIVFDKIGTRNGSLVFFALLIAGTVLLCLTDMGLPQLAFVAVFLYGLGLSLGTVGISVWSIELAPEGNKMKTIRNFQLSYAFGGFVFTLLPGFLTEFFGTYLVTYAILLVLISVAAAVIVGIYFILERKAARAA